MIATRSLVAACAALAAALVSVPALANNCANGGTNWPTCTPPTTTTPAPTPVNSSSAAAQAASSINDLSSSSSRSWSLFLPPPVWTPPMPRPEVPDLCPAPTETQDALSVGSGVVFSKAGSLRDNDPCTAIKYSGILWDRCQYKKSDRALNLGLKLFARKAGEPWDMTDQPDLVDYPTKQCAVLRASAVTTHHTVINNYIAPEPVATPKEQPKAPAKTERKASSGNKGSKGDKFVDPCATASARACVRQK